MHRLYLSLVLPLALVLATCAASVDREEEERIAELLELRPGMHVADVGAGNGGWSEALAHRVGESGHVYVNEIDERELDRIRERISESDLGNLSVVVGEPDSTMLPPACCDAILLRIAYHDFTHPTEMRASLRRSLRPGGLLLIIEMDTDDHGIPEEELVAAMTGDGFRVLSRHSEWADREDRYAVLFTGSSATSSPELSSAGP